MSKAKATKEEEALTRIAIVNSDKCKPRKCRQECKRSCPVVRMGKMYGFFGQHRDARIAGRTIGMAAWSGVNGAMPSLCLLWVRCVCVCCTGALKWRCPRRCPSSPRSSASAVVSASRNVRSKRSTSSICQSRWPRTPRIDMGQTASSCTDCPCPDRDMCWDWSERTVRNRSDSTRIPSTHSSPCAHSLALLSALCSQVSANPPL